MRFVAVIWSWLRLVLRLILFLLTFTISSAIFVIRHSIFLVSLIQFLLHLRAFIVYFFPSNLQNIINKRVKKKTRGHRRKLDNLQGQSGQLWPDGNEEYFDVTFEDDSSSDEDDYFVEEESTSNTTTNGFSSSRKKQPHSNNSNSYYQYDDGQYRDNDQDYINAQQSYVDNKTNVSISVHDFGYHNSGKYQPANHDLLGYNSNREYGNYDSVGLNSIQDYGNRDYNSTLQHGNHDLVNYHSTQEFGNNEHDYFQSAKSSTTEEEVFEREEVNDELKLFPNRPNNFNLPNLSPRRVSRTLEQYKSSTNYSSSKNFWKDKQGSRNHKNKLQNTDLISDWMGNQSNKAPTLERPDYIENKKFDVYIPKQNQFEAFDEDIIVVDTNNSDEEYWEPDTSSIHEESWEPDTSSIQEESWEPDTSSIQEESWEPDTSSIQEESWEPDTSSIQEESWEPETSSIQDESWEPETSSIQEFMKFMDSEDFMQIIQSFNNFKSGLGLKEDGQHITTFFTTLRSHVLKHVPYKYNHTLDMLNEVRNKKVYKDGIIGQDKRVLIIGGGPCGLRAAIEMQLLGAETVVYESRKSINRNNILKLWAFVVEDLKSLGGKKFCPGLGNGSVNHLSIKKLQFILMKVCLVLGVQIKPGRVFKAIKAGTNTNKVESSEEVDGGHKVYEEEFDVILGATGRHVLLDGFERKSLEAKMAIAITANFKNFNSAEEKYINEIPGLSKQYDQKFFNSLELERGIKLENIVYYQGATHYFVMTAKKQSLLDRGVIFQDSDDRFELLRPENIDQRQLEKYAREAAEFSTGHFSHKLPNNPFETWKGKTDASIFDFTQLYRSENACRIVRKDNSILLTGLIGDSLLEPFWPEGTGIGMGFLGVLDTAWMVRRYFMNDDNYELIREREKLYSLVRQTSGKAIKPSYDRWSLDPRTRYTSTTFNFSQTKISELAGQAVVSRDRIDAKIKARSRKETLRKTRFFGDEIETDF